MKWLTVLIILFAGCDPTRFCDAKEVKTFTAVTEEQLHILDDYNRLLFSVPTDTIINYSNAHKWIAEEISDSARRSRDQFFVVGPNERLFKYLTLFDSLQLSNGPKANYGSINGYVHFRPKDSTVIFSMFTTVCKDSAVEHSLIYQRVPNGSFPFEYDAKVKAKSLMNGWNYVITTVEYRGM